MSKQYTNIRNNFKLVRQYLKLTQIQVAAFLELDRKVISGFERGVCSLSVSSLERACQLFGINYAHLLDEEIPLTLATAAVYNAGLSSESLEDIAAINTIALNVLEMEKLLQIED